MLQFKFKSSLLAEFLLTQETSFFFLSKPSTDWMRPTTLWRAMGFNQTLLI